MFASIVPVGLAIMAWHHETRARDVTASLRLQAEAAQKQAEQLEEEWVAA